MPQKLLAATGVTHVQPWYKVGKSWQPSEIMQARRDFFFPCSDDFSRAWRKFLQTFCLHRFALELGRGTGNFSTEEGKECLEISMSWDAEACCLAVIDQSRWGGLQVLAFCRQVWLLLGKG